MITNEARQPTNITPLDHGTMVLSYPAEMSDFDIDYAIYMTELVIRQWRRRQRKMREAAAEAFAWAGVASSG